MNYPLVFIPGLFGSLGDDLIKGTGEFSFGLAEKIYKPFIKILNSMGYLEGENLFISYYDWKMSVLAAVDKYLYEDIERAKMKASAEKVIIIGHSLGGLLGRAYMTYFKPESVDKLIMIGSPNLGAVNAYYFWSGGKLPYPKIENNILYNGLKYGFSLYYNLYNNRESLDILRDIFPVGKDLLPAYGYGNYLYSMENGRRNEVDIEDMSIENSFLNDMNKRTIDSNRVYIIAGKGDLTSMELVVEIDHKTKYKWLDGKPIGEYQTNYGDGTVTTFSSLGNLTRNNIVIDGNHSSILYKSRDYLSAILGRPMVEKVDIVTSDLDIITSDNRASD